MTQEQIILFQLPYEFRAHIGIVNFWRKRGTPLRPTLEMPLSAARNLCAQDRAVYLAAIKKRA